MAWGKIISTIVYIVRGSMQSLVCLYVTQDFVIVYIYPLGSNTRRLRRMILRLERIWTELPNLSGH